MTNKTSFRPWTSPCVSLKKVLSSKMYLAMLGIPGNELMINDMVVLHTLVKLHANYNT